MLLDLLTADFFPLSFPFELLPSYDYPLEVFFYGVTEPRTDLDFPAFASSSLCDYDIFMSSEICRIFPISIYFDKAMKEWPVM